MTNTTRPEHLLPGHPCTECGERILDFLQILYEPCPDSPTKKHIMDFTGLMQLRETA